MKIAYDKEVDALNITLKQGRVYRTAEIAPEVLIDFDKKGDPLYIEIIGATEKFGKANFSKVKIGGKLVPLPAGAF
ncbi:MAG: DUF2283 domain-containing protein [Patescibacteria group bacterium]